MPLNYSQWSEDNLGMSICLPPFWRHHLFLVWVQHSLGSCPLIVGDPPVSDLPHLPVGVLVLQTLSLLHSASTWTLTLSHLSIFIVFNMCHFLTVSYCFLIISTNHWYYASFFGPSLFCMLPRTFRRMRSHWGCASLKLSYICFSEHLVRATLVGSLLIKLLSIKIPGLERRLDFFFLFGILIHMKRRLGICIRKKDYLC